MRATVDGVSFDEWPRDLSNAFVISPQGLVGWFGGVTPRFDAPDRPTSHGSFDAPGFLSGRIVSITGTILGSSESMLDALVEELGGLLADGGESVLTVQDGSGDVTYARVRLGAETTIERFGDGSHTAAYQVQFRAADPRRYGEARTFTGASVVPYQRGNFPATPEVTVSGTFPGGYRIGYGGAEFIVSAALASGQSHVIDMRTGWVRRNGVVLPGAATRAELFTVKKGRQTLAMSVSPRTTGSGSLSVEVHDTYV